MDFGAIYLYLVSLKYRRNTFSKGACHLKDQINILCFKHLPIVRDFNENYLDH